MGGDQCYPQATREEYKKRLLLPFSWAFTVPSPDRKLFAIPGNHDWYDGLIAFDSLFCSAREKLSNAKGNNIGGWQCQQHRSYWALRLPHNWWIWGADIQFSKYLDSAQVNYFEAVAQQMGPQDNLIICLAEPSWLLADLQGQDEEENFLQDHGHRPSRGARVVAVIAGDWHQYNRYYANELDVHFITSGGGGAFLHPTHVLRNSISVHWPERQEQTEEAAGSQTTNPAPVRSPEGKHTTSASSATPRRRRPLSTRPCRTSRTSSSSRCRRAVWHACASGRRCRRRHPNATRQEPKLPAEPRQRVLPLLQSGLRHRPRRHLLDDHLAVPVAGRPARHLVGKIDQLGIDTTVWSVHVVHAALPHTGDDQLDQPDRSSRRALCHAALVRWTRSSGPDRAAI
jgi:hypothetical protein